MKKKIEITCAKLQLGTEIQDKFQILFSFYDRIQYHYYREGGSQNSWLRWDLNL